jgi:D-alanyl-D-alanine carboxypeptidase (penicillin-binding protein 5/6)
VAALGPLPTLSPAAAQPTLAAKGITAVDVASGTVLLNQSSTTKLPIASLTKMVTALVIISRHNLTDTITIPSLPIYQPEDERIGLVAGEQYSVQDLLRALLIQSANDAADSLAIADAGSGPAFAARMNAKMSQWGITDAHFTNPSGLSDTDNFASATALAKIANLLLTNAFLRQTVAQQTATVTAHAGRQLNLATTNQLLLANRFYGIKTGYTAAAGECFVGLTRIDGHEVVTVVLGSNDRFGVTQTLADWITRSWQWQ